MVNILNFVKYDKINAVIQKRGKEMPFFKLGKTHIPHRKNTSGKVPVRINSVSGVRIPLSQHIGAPAKLIANVGDHVFVGTLIAEAGGYVSANIHSSVSGTVKKIDNILQSSGRSVPAVFIESDGLMEPDPSAMPPSINSLEELSSAVLKSGLVGLGGAGFPTHVKIDGAKRGGIDKIVINAAECEPYITSDTRTMLDDWQYVKAGVELLLKFIPAEAIIGIESNKTEAIARMTEVFGDNDRVRVDVLPDTYPQGGEKVLIYNTTGREVPEGKLPSDVGVLIMNVTSVSFLAKYAQTGMPLVEKCVTLDGDAVAEPKNLIVPIGTSVGELIELGGGLKARAGKILYGGPMMGVSMCFSDEPVMKNTNAITVLSTDAARISEEGPCIHCGRCVNTCPMGLNPTAYAKAMNLDDHAERAERLNEEKVMLCIECGSCSFVCPAKRPLVENNRLGKAELREYLAVQKSKGA